MSHEKGSSYAQAGVDSEAAGNAVGELVSLLGQIDTGRPSRSTLPPGHYASVVAIDGQRGVAISTDGVGSKVIVAQQMGNFETIGIDCIAMNVNDVVCVGAEPFAVVDYIAVERANSDMLRAIGAGLKRGAELAGVEVPGGELAQLEEVIRGHPSPYGFDLVGTCIGLVDLDKVVSGKMIGPGDAIIGLPSSGIHSNGLTLARKALLEKGDLDLESSVDELGRSIGEELLEPTAIYVKAVLALLGSGIEVHGLAHITSGGMDNLLRLNDGVGYQITDPLPVPAIFKLVQRYGEVSGQEMNYVFNMGCGFCAIVAEGDSGRAVELLRGFHPGTARIGTVTTEAGSVS